MLGKFVIGFVIGLIVIPAVAAVIALSGHFPFEATAKPPRLERKLANMALDPAMDAKAEEFTNPLTATEANLMKGMKIYRTNCAECHGEPGKPSKWGRNNFYPPAPQLADRGIDDPVQHIFVAAKYGIRYTGMGGWKDVLPDDDLWCVAMFLHEVKSLPPAVAAGWTLPLQPAASDSGAADPN